MSGKFPALAAEGPEASRVRRAVLERWALRGAGLGSLLTCLGRDREEPEDEDEEDDDEVEQLNDLLGSPRILS